MFFFSSIRQRGGWNNNPSAIQFRAEYKQLLVRNEIKVSNNANVTSQCKTPLLSCFSVAPSVAESIFKNVTAERLFDLAGENEMSKNDDTTDIDLTKELNGIDITSSVQNCDQMMVKNYINSFSMLHTFSEYRCSIIVFIAGYIVRALLKKIKCPGCCNSLLYKDGNLNHGEFLCQRNFGRLKKTIN